MSTFSSVNCAPAALGPEKFHKGPGETILFKGNLGYDFDGPRLKDFWSRPSGWDNAHCTAFLTNTRFVATRERQHYLFGPLIWLIMALIPRKIIFSVRLDELAAIRFDASQPRVFVLQTTSGREYTLVSSILFNFHAEWIAHIATAATRLVPPLSAKKSKTGITFSRGQGMVAL